MKLNGIVTHSQVGRERKMVVKTMFTQFKTVFGPFLRKSYHLLGHVPSRKLSIKCSHGYLIQEGPLVSASSPFRNELL